MEFRKQTESEMKWWKEKNSETVEKDRTHREDSSFGMTCEENEKEQFFCITRMCVCYAACTA